MSYTRREFGKLALAGLPAVALLERPLFGSALAQAKPNSLFSGVQIGVITYSYRSMQDQSAEATLKYVLDSGISGIELMDGPAEMYAGRPPAAQRGGGPGGPPGGGGGRGPGGTGAPPAAAAAGAAGAVAAAVAGAAPPAAQRAGGAGRGAGIPENASFNGQPCSAARGGGGGAPGGGGRGQRAQLSPEQQAEQQAAAQAAADALKKWRTSVSMDKFKALKKMYNDAGVTIYAYKSDGMQKNLQTSDEELDYLFNVAAALGANHTTMELPNVGPDGTAMLKRMAQFAEKHKIYVAYHTHGQGSMTAFDEALAMSKWNMSNVDLGHYVAAGNVGGTPIQFLEKFHERIASFHLKDRTLPEHCSLTVPFGTGDGQIKEILLTLKKNKWTIPATIELEYPIPQGSDAVQETRKCMEFSRDALA
jgi:sugar phosphate isomerase/epimerase